MILMPRLELAETCDHPLSHLFIFDNIFIKGHDFDAVTVTRSKKFIFLY